MIDNYGYNWEKQIYTQLQQDAVGKTISNVVLKDDVLTFTFEDGSKLKFYDDGQNCCENRYFSCDGDDLSEFIGSKYIEAFVKDAPDIEDLLCGDVHEVCFLEVRTTVGSITVSAHNEHSGYYSGFGIVVKG